jgi:hypothetical protein
VLEGGEYRWPHLLEPDAVLVEVQAEAIAIPRNERCGVAGSNEVTPDAVNSFHVTNLLG